MASVLDTLAATIKTALSSTFAAATLTRHVEGTIVDPADPPAPSEAEYVCRALIEDYSIRMKAEGLVQSEDRQVLILAGSLSVTPIVNDTVTIGDGPHSGETFTLMSIGTDPARAVWMCRGHPR
jgi:hypothetical protein